MSSGKEGWRIGLFRVEDVFIQGGELNVFVMVAFISINRYVSCFYFNLIGIYFFLFWICGIVMALKCWRLGARHRIV